MTPLFGQALKVINAGLPSFAESIADAGGEVLQLDWRPPADGRPDTGRELARLIADERIEQANQTAMAALLASQPVLSDVSVASACILALAGERLLLHAGPPVAWADMCGPMRGAIIGAALFEGWADTPEAAEKLAKSGGIAFAPCHHYGAVGPMAGLISPSMPLWTVGDANSGARAYSSLNEGLGKVLRFGAYDPEVIERLRWMADVLAPVLAEALRAADGIELKPLMAQSLHMGDELHNRNTASSALLLKRLLPGLLQSPRPAAETSEAARFIAGNDHFFLNVSMAACKLATDAAHGVPHSSLVTAMARNGVEFGIRLSGAGDAWFTAPAPAVQGLFFSGYGPQDAAPDLGDSAITETAGLGGFALAGAPAIVRFVGGSPADAQAVTRRMRRITLGVNPAYTLPSLGFAGVPAGIDARLVADRSIAPVIDTGIAHRQAGIGQVGAGLSHAPHACFSAALDALGRTLPDDGAAPRAAS